MKLTGVIAMALLAEALGANLRDGGPGGLFFKHLGGSDKLAGGAGEVAKEMELEKSLKAALANNTNLAASNAHLRTEVADLTISKTKLEAQVANMAAGIKKLNQNVQDCGEARMRSYKVLVEQKQAQKEERDKDIAKLESEKKELNDLVHSLQIKMGKLAAANLVKNALREQKEEEELQEKSEQEIEKLKDDKKDLKNEVDAVQKSSEDETAKLESENTALKKEEADEEAKRKNLETEEAKEEKKRKELAEEEKEEEENVSEGPPGDYLFAKARRDTLQAIKEDMKEKEKEEEEEEVPATTAAPAAKKREWTQAGVDSLKDNDLSGMFGNPKAGDQVADSQKSQLKDMEMWDFAVGDGKWVIAQSAHAVN